MSRVSQPHIRFTVDEFAKLVESDALGNRRVELLNGRIYRMAPQAVPHLVTITKGSRTFGKVVKPSEWLIIQGTIKLSAYTAPDLDFLWLPCVEGTPLHAWPTPVLVVEVSDATYRKDSGVKLRNYALHGVPEYWIENLKADRIEVYRDPLNPTGRLEDCHYRDVQHFTRGAAVSVAARPGVSILVDDLLP